MARTDGNTTADGFNGIIKSMYIKLTRIDGRAIWLNASFVVTVEPTRIGGSIVVPIGDGLDYEVREPPEVVLAMLDGAPVPKVVPVPPPKSLAPQPEDVSPSGEDVDPVEVPDEKKEPAAEKVSGKKGGKRRGRKGSGKAEPKNAPPPDTPEPDGFKEIVADLKARKCRTGKRLRNAIKSYFGKTDETEIDYIIETMINKGYMLVAGDGHVTWIESPAVK